MAVQIESAWPRHPDYRIAIESSRAKGQVWQGDVLLAESEECLIVEELKHTDRLYFPEKDVRWELFEPTDHHTICPFKGQADYWSLTGTGAPEENVVWTYRTPFPEVAGIEGHVCFYHERLRVVLQERWPDGSVVTSEFPTWGDASELVRLIDVQPAAKGRFIGPAHGYSRRDVVEGGQLLAQAVVAANKSVPGQRVTSVSMVFSKAASFEAPVELDVEVLRNGRSFSTVEVRTTQEGSLRAAGLVLMESGGAEMIKHTVDMPDVPGPEKAVPCDFGVTGREFRVVEGAYDHDPDRVGPAEIYVWARFREAPTEQHLHAALLSQSTSHWTIGAAMLPHRGIGLSQAHVTLSTGVMKSTVVFHDEADVSDWLLYSNSAIWAGRGLTQAEGRVFSRDGRLAASYSVQSMIRPFAKDSATSGEDYRSDM